MALSLAHLGPSGTNAETAALAYADWLLKQRSQQALLCPYPTITQTGQAVAEGKADLGIVPVENSTEGSVAVTLDLLWQYDQLQIQQELVLPITHALLSHSLSLSAIKIIYSHPQALAQCQQWLERNLPSVPLVASNSTAEAVRQVMQEPTAGAIASPRTAKLYGVPILTTDIQDYPENCTRFWILGLTPTQTGDRLSLAFSVPANVPGSLVKPLQAFAKRGINLSRIESRPTKRSLGDYLFFVDLAGNMTQSSVQAALTELASYTAILKIFGNYSLLTRLDIMSELTVRNQVFISYSHQDRQWLDKLKKNLKLMKLNVWDDTQIPPGAIWRKEIEKALTAAKVAVLLVSPDFFASDFITNNELPPLLDAAEAQGLTIIWIPISFSLYEETEIAKYQAVHNPSEPLDSLETSQQNKALVKICQAIKQATV